MAIRYGVLGMLLLGLACAPPVDNSQTEFPQQSESAATSNQATDPKLEVLSETGIELNTNNFEVYLLDDSVPDGKPKNPLVFFQGERAHMDGVSERVRVDGIKGIIYRKEGDDLKFEGRKGVYDQKSNHIAMQGPIRLWFEGVMGELNDMEWDNTAREIRSSSPSTFRGKGVEIESESMTLHPSTGYLKLKDFTSSINLREKKNEQ